MEVVTNPERERVSLTMFFTLDPEKEIEGDRAGAGAGGRGEAQAVREDRGLRSAALGFKCKLSNPVTKCRTNFNYHATDFIASPETFCTLRHAFCQREPL